MGSELAAVVDWCQARPGPAVIARVMSTQGFGGRRSGEVLGITATDVVGGLASGAADAEVVTAARAMISGGKASARVSVSVGDSEAVQAGLACGGRLDVLLQSAATLDEDTTRLLQARTDVVLVTDVSTGETRCVTAASDPQTATADSGRWDAPLGAASRMLAKGPMGTSVVGETGDLFLVEAVTATPTLMVFGRAALADAIAIVGSAIGWTVSIHADNATDATAAAVAASEAAGPNDGVVVLSHDIAASCAVLAAALQGGCGYVGALGSRHTQAARTQHLTNNLAIRSDSAGMVRGPVGLDLGARSPEETALAIVAEMLAVIRQRPASPLATAAR